MAQAWDPRTKEASPNKTTSVRQSPPSKPSRCHPGLSANTQGPWYAETHCGGSSLASFPSVHPPPWPFNPPGLGSTLEDTGCISATLESCSVCCLALSKSLLESNLVLSLNTPSGKTDEPFRLSSKVFSETPLYEFSFLFGLVEGSSISHFVQKMLWHPQAA